MKSADKQVTVPSWEFYDLEKDPEERSNLFNDPNYKKEITLMHAALVKEKAYYEDHLEPVPDL
jgi:hypothetical protein